MIIHYKLLKVPRFDIKLTSLKLLNHISETKSPTREVRSELLILSLDSRYLQTDTLNLVEISKEHHVTNILV